MLELNCMGPQQGKEEWAEHTSLKATTAVGAGLYPSWKSNACALEITVVSLGGSRGTKLVSPPAHTYTAL